MQDNNEHKPKDHSKMSNETNYTAMESSDKCINNAKTSNDAKETLKDVNMADAAAQATATAEADDTSSSTSEEINSGTASDQTTNISSNGGYSGDYESISDSSSGASKKRKALARSGRHRRDLNEDGKDGTVRDAMLEDSQRKLSHEESASAIEYDASARRHHHRADDKSSMVKNVNNTQSVRHHHHHHHNKDRPNEARGVQVHRQINEIMNLYNVSLQARANAQAAIMQDGDTDTNAKADGDASINDKDTTKSHHYRVQTDGSSANHNELRVRMDPSSDPRMDLVKLYRANGSTSAKLGPSSLAASGGVVANADSHQNDTNLECYANLMEACRPFFHDSKTIVKSGKVPMLTTNVNRSQVGSDEAQSSSGFTSFFTTTKSDSNTNSSSQSEFSQHKKKSDDGHTNESKSSPSIAEDKAAKPEHRTDHPTNQNQGDPYQSDSSSMVVLARMKRKHKDQRRHEKTKDEAEAHVSKRVRIETVALDAAKYRAKQKQSANKQPESSSLSSGLSTSVNSSGSETGSGSAIKAPAKQHQGTTSTSVEDRSKTDSQSGSAENSKNQTARTVTDTSGTTTANNSSGSGTGSGNDGDPNNKSESGSQALTEGVTSNSEDKRYCEKDSMSDTNTVAAVNGDAIKKQESSLLLDNNKPMIHRHNGGKKVPVVDHTPQDPLESIVEEPERELQNSPANNVITKEEKLIEKKRKRMSARKEYEEDLQRQMRDSSESSSKPKDADVLEPGKPVTLEDVLSFSKTARLLVQALPPFLAVHTNAAFTLLTGVDSHAIIGQPIASIIAIAEGTPPNKESDSSGSDITNVKDTLSSLSGSIEGNEGRNDADLINANSTNQQGQDQPANDGNVEMNAQANPVPPGFRIDRLIVARGYGHIHNVEVKTLEPHSNSHAIEGSEVKFDEAKSGAKRKKKDEKIFCRMSVSPVVMSIESWDRKSDGHVDSKDHKSGNKRRKHDDSTGCPIVKHYLIQLESMDGPCLLAKRSSFSSSTDTTVEARQLGITRSELVARRCRMESNQRAVDPEVDALSVNRSMPEINFPETDSQDENNSAVEPVATCG